MGDYVRAENQTLDIERGNKNTLTEERLTVRNAGAYIIHPRFITFSLGGTFGLAQERTKAEVDGQEVHDEERDADLLGYDALISFFADSAWSLNLFGNRNKYTQRREFAGFIYTDVENTGATLSARRLYIPSTLTVRQERLQDESQVASVTTRRDVTRNVVTYDGRRGWVDSEMALRYELVEKSDYVRPELDYNSQTGSMYYSLDFGQELNKRWDSRIRASERTGYSEEMRWNVDEVVRIDHTRNLRTQYGYFFTDTERLQGDTTSHRAEFGVRHQLYESLTTEFLFNVIRRDLIGGSNNINSSQMFLDYTKRLPGKGRLLIGLGGYFGKEDDQFDAASVQFLQEPHVFDAPFARPIALERPFVFEPSVSVTRTALGAASGCDVARPLVEGIDYELRTVGNITEIVPIDDCTINPTAGIGPGDIIAVDYQAEAPRKLTFTSTSWNLNTSLDYNWIRPFFIHDEQRQEPDADDPQQAQFLQNRQSDIVGVELRYTGPVARARATVEYERLRSRDQDYYAVRGNELLQYYFSRLWHLNLTARQSVTEFSFPEVRRTKILEARTILRYTASASLYTEFHVVWRSIDDTLVPDEEVREARVQLRWRFGKLEINPSVSYVNRKRGVADLQEYRAFVRAIRRF